jgi:hypothetical protein
MSAPEELSGISCVCDQCHKTFRLVNEDDYETIKKKGLNAVE